MAARFPSKSTRSKSCSEDLVAPLDSDRKTRKDKGISKRKPPPKTLPKPSLSAQQRIEVVSHRIHQTGNQLDQIEEGISELKQGTSRLETKVDKGQQNLDKTKSSLDSQNLQEICDSFKSIQIEEHVENLNRTVSSLENSLEKSLFEFQQGSKQIPASHSTPKVVTTSTEFDPPNTIIVGTVSPIRIPTPIPTLNNDHVMANNDHILQPVSPDIERDIHNNTLGPAINVHISDIDITNPVNLIIEYNWRDTFLNAQDCLKNNWAPGNKTNKRIGTRSNSKPKGCTCPTLTLNNYSVCGLILHVFKEEDLRELDYAVAHQDQNAIRNSIWSLAKKLYIHDQELYEGDEIPNLEQLHEEELARERQEQEENNPEHLDSEVESNHSDLHSDSDSDSDTEIMGDRENLLRDLKSMMTGLQHMKFNGDTNAFDGQDHINRFMNWFRLLKKPLHVDPQDQQVAENANRERYNNEALKLCFPLSLEGKALTWYQNKGYDANYPGFDQVTTDFLAQYSKWGECLSQKLAKFTSYQWNPITTSVTDMINDVKSLGRTLGKVDQEILWKIKSICPSSYQLLLVDINELAQLEHKLKEYQSLTTSNPQVAASMPGATATVAAAQTGDLPPYLMTAIRKAATEAANPKDKEVSFGETDLSSLSNKLDKIETAFNTTLNKLENKVYYMQEDFNRGRSREKDHEKSGRDKSFDRSRSKSPYPRSSSQEKKKVKCYNCESENHLAYDCDHLKYTLKKLNLDPNEVFKRKPKPFSNAASSSSSKSDNNELIAAFAKYYKESQSN